jgi:hypothetical protein
MKRIAIAAAALALGIPASAGDDTPSPRTAAKAARVSVVEFGPAKHPYCFLVDGHDLGSDATRAVGAVRDKGVRRVRFRSHRKEMPISECDLYSLFSQASITVLEFRVARGFLAHPDLTRSWWPPCGSETH